MRRNRGRKINDRRSGIEREKTKRIDLEEEKERKTWKFFNSNL